LPKNFKHKGYFLFLFVFNYKFSCMDVQIRPMTSKQFAERYGVSRKTFRSWLEPHKKEIGARKGYTWTPSQVRKIMSIFE